MELTDQVLLRIAPQVRLGKELTHIKWEKHPENKNRIMTQIVCKVCGGVIAGQVESDAKVPSRVIHGATYLYKVLTFARFNSYTEIEITFDDDSHHVTHLCTDCVKKLDLPLLEYIYVCDLAQWLWEEQHGYGDAIWHTYSAVIDRVPVSWKDNGGLQ